MSLVTLGTSYTIPQVKTSGSRSEFLANNPEFGRIPQANFQSPDIAQLESANYFKIADAHSIANGNKTIAESAAEIVANIPAFIAASIVSGANQIYNIAPSIGNALGGDFKQASADDWMAAVDDDLLKYYEEHRDGVDTAGFIVGSLVPGMAGVKVLNAGQKMLTTAIKAEKFGEGTSKALGLLVPNRQNNVNNAIKAVINSDSPFRLMEKNVLRAMGAGAGQSVLEATAFEVAVAATMFDSPLLDEQTTGDLVDNIVTGGLVFGAFGGVIEGARSVFAVKGAIKQADKEAMPWTHVMELGKGASASDKLIAYADQLKGLKAIPDDVDEARAAYLQSASDKKVDVLEQGMFTEFRNLAGGDGIIAEQMLAAAKTKPISDILSDFLGAQSAGRLSEVTAAERKYNKVMKLIDKGDYGKLKLSDLDEIANMQVSWQKVWGEDMGRVTSSTPPVPVHLVDTLRKGQEISITENTVRAGNKKYKFNKHSDEIIDRWDITHSDVMTTDARYMWAEKQHLGPEAHIYENDIPLLERAYKQFSPDHTIHTVDGQKLNFAKKEDLLTHITKTKERLANEFLQPPKDGFFLSSPDAVIAKLKELTGIHFGVMTDAEMQKWAGSAYAAHQGLPDGSTRIVLNRDYLTKRSIGTWLGTLKHEEGHSIFNVLLSIGGIPQSMAPTIRAEMEAVSRLQRPAQWKKADATGNYSYLRYSKQGKQGAGRDHELAADTFAYLSKFPEKAEQLAPTFYSRFGKLLRPLDKQVVNQYIRRSHALTQEEIASVLNVRNSYLNGEVNVENVMSDLFARDSYKADYLDFMKKAGAIKQEVSDISLHNIPQHIKVIADTTPVRDLDNNILEGMAVIAQRKAQYVQTVNTAVSSVLGKDFEKLPDIKESDILKVSRLGSERNFVTSPNANYGTLASSMQQIGNITAGIKLRFKQEAREELEPYLLRLKENEAAAIEASTIDATLRAIPEDYALNLDETAIVPLSVRKWQLDRQAAQDAGEEFTRPKPVAKIEGAPNVIPLKNQETRDWFVAHVKRNNKNQLNRHTIRSAQSAGSRYNPDVIYPIPVDQRDFKFFATVSDESITGLGSRSTIYATSQDELDALIKKVKADNPRLKVRTKADTEEYFKSRAEFSYDKTIHDSRFDTMLGRKGVSAPYLVDTDANKIVNKFLNWHLDSANNLAMDAVSAKYEIPFAELKRLGERYTNLQTSKTGNASILKHADASVENPYMDLVKMGLDLKNYTDYPFWVQANRLLDEKLSDLSNRLTQTVESSRSPEQLDKVNQLLEEFGYKGAHYDMEMELLVNHTAPKGVLTKFIQKANALLATTTLRLDALNAVNNAVAAPILLSAETKAVIRAIGRGDEEAVGALAQLAYIKVPGTDKLMLSAHKLIANAIKKFNSTGADMQWYKDHRFVTSISDQYKWTLDELTLAGKETVRDLESIPARVHDRLVAAADAGERWTGNKLAEEFNRFVAADVMKQMTDIAVERGLMTSKEALSYINTFVNRVHGNYLASQRPMLFQGPVGQAIGLFQTYQFNLMQQLLRHVGEGKGKDWATLLGMQASIYGLNGLPAFNAINTHIIGTASGNDEHKDAYHAVYGAVGKEAGDWLMYGFASNMLLDPDLKTNLYVRGDINPRHVTVVPTNPVDVPIVNAFSKFANNLFKTADTLGAGGDMSQTFLQALEHNAISRPLSGLARTLQGLDNPNEMSYSTSSRGNVIAANDFLSLTNLARIAGGKPMAEAIAVDASFRMRTYSLADNNRRQVLGRAIKSTIIAGNTPTQEEVDGFAEQYAAMGGKQEEFNSWMLQLYKSANLSQANELQNNLSQPYAQTMQKIMGGRDLEDFAE